jgi:hypothetical protein
MGNVIKTGRNNLPSQFDPRQTKIRTAGLAAAIKQAQVMKDWVLTDLAIEQLIELQCDFVAWWDAAVRQAGQPVKELSQNEDNSPNPQNLLLISFSLYKKELALFFPSRCILRVRRNQRVRRGVG